MKKVFWAILAVLTIITAGCGEEYAGMNVDAFEIMDSKPYILMDGKLCWWDEEKEWIQQEIAISLKEIFRGDYLCGINEEGALIFETGMTSVEYGAFPLGSAGVFYMAELLVEQSRETPPRTLNHMRVSDACDIEK